MVVIVVTCPECKSDQCQPLFDADNRFGCIPCGHDFLIPPTKEDILAVHAQFGLLDRVKVKAAMGENWPPEWDAILPGQGIFSAETECPCCDGLGGFSPDEPCGACRASGRVSALIGDARQADGQSLTSQPRGCPDAEA